MDTEHQHDGDDVDHRCLVRPAKQSLIPRIQIGSVVTPDPAVNVVTMISSKLRGEGEQAAGEQRRPQLREGDQPERRPQAGPQIGGGVLEAGSGVDVAGRSRC